MCILSLAEGQGSGAIRGGKSRSRGSPKKTTTVATITTFAPPLIMEETSLIESENKHTSTSSVAAIDRIHPLSDLSLFEPGESPLFTALHSFQKKQNNNLPNPILNHSTTTKGEGEKSIWRTTETILLLSLPFNRLTKKGLKLIP